MCRTSVTRGARSRTTSRSTTSLISRARSLRAAVASSAAARGPSRRPGSRRRACRLPGRSGTGGTTTCPTDCAVTPWGSWAAVQAGGSKLRRTRKTTTYESDGGKDCPELEQERAFSDICRATITYSKWSDCSKACGSGYRYRYREHHVCSKTAVLKYQLRFRQGERCNTHDCPSASEKIMLRGALLN